MLPARLSFKFLMLSFCFLPLIASAAPHTAVRSDQTPAAPVYFFANEQVPADFMGNGGSRLAISHEHSKDGQGSLAWHYTAGSQITLQKPYLLISRGPTLTPYFLLWIYQAKPQKGALHFAFYTQEAELKHFDYPLQFSGWRGLAVPYVDMPGTPLRHATEIARVVISAPAHAGTVYFDQLLLSAQGIGADAVPDRALPFINPASQKAVNRNWNGLYTFDRDWQKAEQGVSQGDLGNAANTTIQALQNRLDNVIAGSNPKAIKPKAWIQKAQKLIDEAADFHIQENANGEISGPALVYPSQLEIVDNPLNTTPQQRQALAQHELQIRRLGQWTLAASKLRYQWLHQGAGASAYTDNAPVRAGGATNPQVQKALHTLDQLLLLHARYILDQGFAAGSSYQILHHLGYQTRELFAGIYLSRDLYAQHQLAQPLQQMIAWYSGLGRVLEPVESNDLDVLNTQLSGILESILMMGSATDTKPATQAFALTQFSHWLSQTILTSPGVSGGFKPDGSLFHHAQNYPAYGSGALAGLMPVVYTLSGSPYAVSEAARTQLEQSLEQLAFYTQDGRIPLPLTGRHPRADQTISLGAYKYTPLPKAPTGVRAYNYAAMLVARGATPQDAQKGQSWLLMARGFTPYLVGNEVYRHNNHYGRYARYGVLDFMPANPHQYGFHADGFNWNYYPGTTSIVLPFEQLNDYPANATGSSGDEMLLSEGGFAGAVNNDPQTLTTASGVFAQTVRGSQKWHQHDFVAHKSVFVFGDRVIALGSGIQSQDTEHPVVTTLFQRWFGATKQPVMYRGNAASATSEPAFQAVSWKPIQDGSTVTTDKGATLRTPSGQMFYVPAGEKLVVTRSLQHSPNDTNDQPTQGEFTLAYIDQGNAPQNARYQYRMRLQASQGAPAPDFLILAQTTKVHAVEDVESGQQGFAFFAPVTADKGLKAHHTWVLGASAPSEAIAERTPNGLRLSVNNPDLHFTENAAKAWVYNVYAAPWFYAPSQPVTTTYTLRGHWRVQTARSSLPGQKRTAQMVKTQIKGSNTELIITSQDAAVIHLFLVPAKPEPVAVSTRRMNQSGDPGAR